MGRSHRLGRLKYKTPRRDGIVGLIVLISLMCIVQVLFVYQGSRGEQEVKVMSFEESHIEEDVLKLYRPDSIQIETSETRLGLQMMNANGTSTERFNVMRLSEPQLIFGERRKYKGFLTIGVPSVRRPGTNSDYLFETLSSIIRNTSPVDRPTIVVVVFLCDTNSTYNFDVGNHIYEKYKFYCDTGFIQVIKAVDSTHQILMTMNKTKRDKIERVEWRTKQNIDISTLMLFCKNISEYYIHIEDDVITSRDFISDVYNFMTLHSNWFLLEFSYLGFIGKLFKSSDLEWIAYYLLKNSDSKPCDLLLGKMRVTRGQRDPIHSPYSLFQHIGKYSSLKGKMMPSLDATFKDSDIVTIPMQQLPKGYNPPAEIRTNMKLLQKFPVINAYDNNPTTYCWSKTPHHGEYFMLKFTQPWNFSRVVITTGDASRKRDSLKSGTLDVATISRSTENKVLNCGLFKSIANFVDGDIDTRIVNINIPENIICLKISVKAFNRAWLILREIVLMI